MLSDGEWRKVFDAFQYDAWRFEAQPTYTMPREAQNVALFLRGEDKPADHNAKWHTRVREYREAGKKIGRVRVVRQPLTDYQRYQFAWGIPGNIAAGEDIRILDVTHDDYGLPVTGQDWWMFDESTVVHLNFRPDGTQIGREIHEGDVEQFRAWKHTALAAAIPFAEYMKEHG
ncbi:MULTISPECIES: DUF6879 family protein [Streptomyces]|uniref:DUF6879 family protein n=1 Tax=Streptomyces TaxID=1883 RepID=UPI001661F247|nr:MULTISPECIES: DUF6879 family protein [Streptomyces]MBD0839023.1 hypothetical protein [Streptomyces sp. TRM68416]GGS83998.1 hypothetical protein GCM10010222_26930 [Streptomyces tanashiensis]